MRHQLTFRPEPFPEYFEFDRLKSLGIPSAVLLEGEVSRSSPDYIRWVQSFLNRLLGFRLAVDGISGPATRSAVRGFQQKSGLTVDGILGPETEGALIRAGAGNPPGNGAPFYGPPGGSPSAPEKPSSDMALRVRLSRQILKHTGITLAPSSTTPNGNPRQNIIDSTNGLPARSGCYNFSKCGPTTYLSAKMLQALLNVAKQGNSFYVTSFAGGRHGEGSDHYTGRAVDIGIWNGVSLSTPNSAHTAARNALIGAGSNPSQTFDAYHDTIERNHQNHVHGAFY